MFVFMLNVHGTSHRHGNHSNLESSKYSSSPSGWYILIFSVDTHGTWNELDQVIIIVIIIIIEYAMPTTQWRNILHFCVVFGLRVDVVVGPEIEVDEFFVRCYAIGMGWNGFSFSFPYFIPFDFLLFLHLEILSGLMNIEHRNIFMWVVFNFYSMNYYSRKF